MAFGRIELVRHTEILPDQIRNFNTCSECFQHLHCDMHNVVNFKESEAAMAPRALSNGLFQKSTVQKNVLAWCDGQTTTNDAGPKVRCKSAHSSCFTVPVGRHTGLGIQRVEVLIGNLSISLLQ